ncbi:MAG: V-type ATP synthase subunit D [Promethearchaeota archaeon]|nr:MAG: V-type ATP synthase subunit D [Candidatus Lokiarchaeota archaeon]
MFKLSFREIKPTKTNLISLEKKLELAQKGATFLEFKREQLISQIKSKNQEYRKKLEEFLEIIKRALLNLNEAYKEMGKRDVILISNLSKIQYKPTINVKYAKDIGITYQKIEYDLNRIGRLPAYSFENTSHFIDDLMPLLEHFFDKMINFAEFEDLFFSLALNLKKLNRRITGLKNQVIPSLSDDVRKIKGILEEMDRENFVRLKKTKDLIEKKRK